MKPTASKHTILNQICNLIPRNLVPRLASKHGVDKKARSFSPWSHVVAMLHAQLAHSLSLNDVADTMRNHACGSDHHPAGLAAQPKRTLTRQSCSQCRHG